MSRARRFASWCCGGCKETAEGVAAAMGGRAEVEIEPSYDARLINDDEMVEVVRETLRSLLAERTTSSSSPSPTWGSRTSPTT